MSKQQHASGAIRSLWFLEVRIFFFEVLNLSNGIELSGLWNLKDFCAPVLDQLTRKELCCQY